MDIVGKRQNNWEPYTYCPKQDRRKAAGFLLRLFYCHPTDTSDVVDGFLYHDSQL